MRRSSCSPSAISSFGLRWIPFRRRKKGAVGVRGMRLADGDALTAIHLLGEGESAQTEVKKESL